MTVVESRSATAAWLAICHTCWPSSLTARYRTRADCSARSSSTGATSARTPAALVKRSTTVISLSGPAVMTRRGKAAAPSSPT